MIEPHPRVSLVRKCERFQVNRSSVYYRLKPVRNVGSDYFDELLERVIHSVIPAYSFVIPASSSVIPASSSVIPASSSVIPASSSAPSSVIPAYSFVIPTQAGIQKVLKA